MKRNAALQQYFTPAWVAEALVRHFYADLTSNDVVVEPACGDGRFLMAIPSHVPAFGVEIDPAVAMEARMNSGREVVIGDFSNVALPRRPTVVIGNPPFAQTVVDSFLERCKDLLDEGGRISWILPSYLLQTASTVCRYNRHFSLSQTMLPRNIFPGISKPLLFAQFVRSAKPIMTGLFLYRETDAVSSIKTKYRLLFVGNESRASLWAELLEKALVDLGGEADLDDVYAAIENKRPTANPFWREQLRKVAAQRFVRVGRGRYSLHKLAA